MTEQPKRRLKMKVRKYRCNACGGAHAHWWLTSKAVPPSCVERINRRAAS